MPCRGPPAETLMVPPLLLSLAAVLAQGEPPAEPRQEPAPAATAPPPTPPDRWLLMKALQGTWPGWLLDGNRLQITGWTDVSFTASTARDSQLPMGFNYLANEFQLQQNWLRF